MCEIMSSASNKNITDLCWNEVCYIFEMHCGYRVYETHINSHMRREVYDYQNR